MEIKNIGLVKKLTKSVLTEKEALVYVSVLELKGAFPSRIAKYAGIRRPTAYDVLTTLSIRGLVNEIKNKNKIFYQIEKPENILKFTKVRLSQAEESVNKIDELLPELKDVYVSGVNQPKITYYSGEKGLFEMFDDMTINQKSYEMLNFTNGKEFVNILDDHNIDFYRQYIARKGTNGITTRIIMPSSAEDKKAREVFYEKVDKKYWPECRYIEEGKFPSASEITVYGTNKVAISNFKKDQETGVIIEDQAIHDMMKSIFELSWESKRIKTT
jgi:sugar-specific transcriptional regulator TrmB